MRWIPPAAVNREICRRLVDSAGVEGWMAELLVRRGLGDANECARFLSPRLRELSDPFALPGMEAAATRILRAVDCGERVVLYGDYDVDGVCSLALLVRGLRAFGCEAATFLPMRAEEGYGLSADGVARCMERHAPQLLVAVDCGTTSVKEIARLNEAGVDVVVLDHHEPRPELPPAVAVVNPKLGAAQHYLCSAGIVFKTLHALLKRRPIEGFDLKSLLDLVAVATIADVVPLLDENRILARAGLDRLPATQNEGLRALIEVAALKSPFTSSHIGFGIGPRLNAAGRLACAEAALELLLTDDPVRARLLAKSLDHQNRERRLIESDVAVAAEAQYLNTYDAGAACGIVLGGAGWHQGVVGIVASRILRKYHRPTIVIGFDTMGVGKGSGRSIEGFSMVEALGQCSGHLEKFGGHEMAAGLTIRQELLEDFRAAFDRAARAMLSEDHLQPRLHLDAEIPIAAVGMDTLASLAALEPHGPGNLRPVFFARRVNPVEEPRVMKEKHLAFTLRQDRGPCRAVWWSAADFPLPEPPWDVAFTIERNVWNGTVSPQLQIRDIRPASGA